MDKIYYVHNSVLAKPVRCYWADNTIVKVAEELPFGKVKVETYGWDISRAYSQVNAIGNDVIDKKDINELNWDNLMHDLTSEGLMWKYSVLSFLKAYYPYHFRSVCKAIWPTGTKWVVRVYWNDEKIAEIDLKSELPEWCGEYEELWEIDEVMKHMISIGVEKENAEEMRRIIRTDPATQKLVIDNKQQQS